MYKLSLLVAFALGYFTAVVLHRPRKQPADHAVWWAQNVEDGSMQEFSGQIALGQTKRLRQQGKTKSGADVTFESPSMFSSDPSIVECVPDAQNEGAFLVTGKADGTCQLTFNADARPGTGEVPFTDVKDIVCHAPDAQTADWQEEDVEPVA